MTAAALGLRQDVKVMSLVGVAHGLSHFYQLVLPPLFPMLKVQFGVSYAELGLIMTLFYVVSGVAQTPAGFLCDRWGAKRIMIAGLAVMGGAILLMGIFQSFTMLLVLAVIAALGNSVFHPADYAILSASVHNSRMGRAYSVHTLGGNLGWAAAPVFMIAMSSAIGWHAALVIAGAIGLVVVLVLIQQHESFKDESKPAASGEQTAGPAVSPLAVLTSRPIVLCLLFFVCTSFFIVGFQSFGATAMAQIFSEPLVVANGALTALLVAASCGTLVGGFMVDKTHRHEIISMAGLAICAALMAMMPLLPLGGVALIAMLALVGFCLGVTYPARDMIARSAAPKGSTGKVFGFVYSGLDLGSAIAPPLLGTLLDLGRPHALFWAVAVMLALAVLTVSTISVSVLRPSRAAAE